MNRDNHLNIFSSNNRKSILKIFILVVYLTLISCASEEVIIPIEKITDSKNIYKITDFEKIGFKKSTKYSVENLPSATSAYFGFIKDLQGKPEDYEIRFYSTHLDAINEGTKYADNITGEDSLGGADLNKIGSIRALPHFGDKGIKKKSAMDETYRYWPLLRGIQESIKKIRYILIESHNDKIYLSYNSKKIHSYLIKNNFVLKDIYKFPFTTWEDRFYFNKKFK